RWWSGSWPWCRRRRRSGTTSRPRRTTSRRSRTSSSRGTSPLSSAGPNFPPPAGPPAFPPPSGPPVQPPFGDPVQFAPPTPEEAAQHGALSSVLGMPSRPTIPLNKLAPEAALRRLELAIVRRLEGFLHGDHLGLLPGPGSDTSDARAYVAGEDDVRKIDWAVT